MAEQGPALADHTPIFALLSAEAVSQVGNTMTVTAGSWFVLETTGSAASGEPYLKNSRLQSQ